MMLRLTIAAILSGVIGFERELKNHSAGFRTHILVGIGACLMMLLSLYGFDQYIDKHPNIRFDPARIPSYVISGIGFLGAGTIMVHGVTIKGLTTAASIWTVAGLGLIVGAGMYAPAVLTTIVVLLSLIFLNHFDRFFRKDRHKNVVRLIINSQEKVEEVITIFNEHNWSISKMEIEKNSPSERTVIIEMEPEQNIHYGKLLNELTKIDGVQSISKL
ncbi:MgtC/SapB family protein [Salirhabdus salicampi]|uniref:MgtC/SapB family protein n=1 Tax=Salirhabdus salicampi TaxID=476102 RepID=UPI0020C368BE|nr:MgtC/SapB family protein [Salirhabdus salicampi]MCP8618078.1 MgtC/SapB family protein [Salirhabdus salicampi]